MVLCAYNNSSGGVETGRPMGLLASQSSLLGELWTLSPKTRWMAPGEQHLRFYSSLNMHMNVHTHVYARMRTHAHESWRNDKCPPRKVFSC